MLSPALSYPLAVAPLLALDHVTGSRMLLYLVGHEQRLLLDNFIADYLASLPGSYLLAAGLLAIFFALRWTGVVRSHWWLLTLGAAVGWLIGGALSGTWFGLTPLALSLGLGLSGALLGIFTRPLLEPAGYPR